MQEVVGVNDRRINDFGKTFKELYVHKRLHFVASERGDGKRRFVAFVILSMPDRRYLIAHVCTCFVLLRLMYSMLYASYLSTMPRRYLIRHAIFSQAGPPRRVVCLAPLWE